ncbi:MAG: hypothetical protein QOF89_5070 [Acidobacteriota bacterium]|nr:hypothetical protein [Acidobacteriota bacterium]
MEQLAAGSRRNGFELRNDLGKTAWGSGHFPIVVSLCCLPNKKSGREAHFLPTVTGQGKLAYPL